MQRRGAQLPSIEDAFALEYAVGQNVMNYGDFHRGVDALLISKSKVFDWRPKTLAELPSEFGATIMTPAANAVTWDPVKPFPA